MGSKADVLLLQRDELGSQHQHIGSLPPVTPTPEDLTSTHMCTYPNIGIHIITVTYASKLPGLSL